MPSGDWRDRAACAGMDVDLFYGAAVQSAKNICRTYCPVRAECLDYAMSVETVRHAYGVWGGMSADERDALRRRGRRSRQRRCDEPGCGQLYTSRHSTQRYCSRGCAARARRRTRARGKEQRQRGTRRRADRG